LTVVIKSRWERLFLGSTKIDREQDSRKCNRGVTRPQTGVDLGAKHQNFSQERREARRMRVGPSPRGKLEKGDSIKTGVMKEKKREDGELHVKDLG